MTDRGLLFQTRYS